MTEAAALESIIANLPVGIYRTTAAGDIVEANPALAALFGAASVDEIKTVNTSTLFAAGEDRAGHLAKRRDAGGVVEEVLRFKRLDGTEFWGLDVSRAILGPDGEVDFTDGSIQDITERVETRAEIDRARLEYQALVEGANDIIYTHDLEGRMLSVNDRAVETFGYTRDELQTMSMADIVDAAYLERAATELAAKAAGEKDRSEPYEVLAYAKDGTPVWIEVSSRLMEADDGQRAWVHGVARNITARKAAQAAATRTEQLFRTVHEKSPAAIIHLAPDGHVIRANPAASRLFGRPEKDLLGTTFNDITHAEDRADSKALFRQLLDGQTDDVELEKRYLHADGHIIWARVRAVATRDDEGSLEYVMSMIEDVTEAKEQVEKLAFLNRLSNRMNSARSIDDAVEEVLGEVCSRTRWQYGEAWTMGDDGALEIMPAWTTTRDGLEKFRKLSEKLTFLPGEGLPGLAWKQRAPVWTEDLTADPVFVRAGAARAAGLHAGLAVPVLLDDAPVAVLVFMMAASSAQDAPLVQLIATAAAQLGPVLRRRQDEADQGDASVVLQGLVDGSEEGMLSVSTDGDILAVNRTLVSMAGEELAPGAHPDVAALRQSDDFMAFVQHLYTNREQADVREVIWRRTLYRRRNQPLRAPDGTLLGRMWFFDEVMAVA